MTMDIDPPEEPAPANDREETQSDIDAEMSVNVEWTPSSSPSRDLNPRVGGNSFDASSVASNRQPISVANNTAEVSGDAIDLLERTQGLFRLLDLYSENSGNGLIDKIIIAQKSLGQFLNTVSPGSYRSVTRIDFQVLDALPVKPIGIYGSKSEIIRLMKEAGAINEEVARLLAAPHDAFDHVKPHLRSGIYALIPQVAQIEDAEQSPVTVYIIYWPEDGTWDGGATGSVRKNRVTFMRYLTRITDQIRALISPAHAKALVWSKEAEPADTEMEDQDSDSDDGGDRFFKFEVAKTSDQEEGVVVRSGITVDHFDITRLMASVPQRTGPDRLETFTPSFLAGETTQVYSSQRYVHSQLTMVKLPERMNTLRFGNEIRTFANIVLDNTVDEETLDILCDNTHLKPKIVGPRRVYNKAKDNISSITRQEEKKLVDQASTDVDSRHDELATQTHLYLLSVISAIYPALNVAALLPQNNDGSGSARIGRDPNELDHFKNIRLVYPVVNGEVETVIKEHDLPNINSYEYTTLKKRLLVVRKILEQRSDLSSEQIQGLESSIMTEGELKLPVAAKASGTSNPFSAIFTKFWPGKEEGSSGQVEDFKSISRDLKDHPDPSFLAMVQQLASQKAIYKGCAEKLVKLALTTLGRKLSSMSPKLVEKIEQIEFDALQDQIRLRARRYTHEELEKALTEYRRSVRSVLFTNLNKATLTISRVQKCRGRHVSDYEVEAFYERKTPSAVQHSLWELILTADDKRRLQEDEGHLPSIRFQKQPMTTYNLPPDFHIKHFQMINGKKCLVVAETPDALGPQVWLVSTHVDIASVRPTKSFNRIPGDYVVAVDEQRRLVAFVSSGENLCFVYVYVMDESFTSIRARGPAVDVSNWYQDGSPKIIAASFFSGTEDLCLLEESGRVRVLSLVSQSFRPATIHLPTPPLCFQSTPDGSALVVVELTQTKRCQARVFHQASFGQNPTGIVVELPEGFEDAESFRVTSLAGRSNTVILALVPSSHCLLSAFLDISRKETEYQFRAKKGGKDADTSVPTKNNSLLDCFSEMWSRYPVVAAIPRVILSGTDREARSVTFVTNDPGQPFPTYFRHMVRDFERLSRKPTDNKLENIAIAAAGYRDLEWKDPQSSVYKCGEWLAELLCLIPIHIAVARDNQFVPLKDGVFDAELERELLGAEVSKIIDSISVGWYESIFSSYMATKPVRVVSSMGEQSVGKSYALNHLTDSSFSNAPQRETEGVWMSLCPTKDYLVVALDFEGVHSIERTAQEDMLLVLFNTALSNLILFRNNFALSRDVANMFTSFQASTHLFDPAANPKLFKGLLAIVIKDVVDSDKNGIVQEFSSKFSQIVSHEQEANFITVLHNSQLQVVPWSVIQSKEFYIMFGKLRKLLFRQTVTHGSAGEFLMTLKTLMAKLKAQDWGSIDQTVIKHRVTLLQAQLHSALSIGQTDSEVSAEPLKNLDNQNIVPRGSDLDLGSHFYLGDAFEEAEQALRSHLQRLPAEAARLSLTEVNEYLRGIASTRVAYVGEWLSQNTDRFPADNADIRSLKRSFDEAVQSLQSNLQLCLAGCSSCGLRCMLSKSHSQLEGHSCGTSHKCLSACEYAEEHDAEEACGLQAGHSGRHLCDPSLHVCGQPCYLSDKNGCQSRCTKASNHDDGVHLCSNTVIHQCGEPCRLQDIPTPTGGHYSCTGRCTLSYDEDHQQHMCENRMSCPIKCALCQRYCAMGDHFHGLEDGAVHLCMQEHACPQLCESQGICEVNTTPHSVNSTFRGRHGTFQYTKYSQVAKRLRCAIPVAPGQLGHLGAHVHSIEREIFHYCEAKCENCNYICQLPLGHRQTEHETAHGSMENTNWAIEGEHDAFVEVQGRKYGSRDDGAPQLCSSVCRDLGRHAHIAYCRNPGANCQEPETEHIEALMVPNPHRPKDWVSHKVFWTRTGFKDPYSRDEQTEFALCDAHCPGQEHQGVDGGAPQPSYCTLPIFHPPQPLDWQPAGNNSYVSQDGHAFACENPQNLRRGYHVIFVLDRSGSMSEADRRPLANQPVTEGLVQHCNNRWGAVLSALYAFCVSRHNADQGPRTDRYSIVPFDTTAQILLADDPNSTPENMVRELLRGHGPGGGTDFNVAIATAQAVMEQYWSDDRSPVIIFLSDGEARLPEAAVQQLCNSAVGSGSPVSLHTVSFGRAAWSRPLRDMATIADNIARAAPPNPQKPILPSAYTDTIDTVRLAETFMNIAESLKKPRAALLRV